MPILSCEHVSLSYDRRRVVEDLSFSLPRGARLCVLGENGSGKSTLLRAMAGLKDCESGRIVYGEGVRGNIGYLPQKSPDDTHFPATVREVVAAGVRAFPLFSAREVSRRVTGALEALSVSGLARESMSELSGGQRQRVYLARALAAGEELLLLDEPVTGLDPIITHELYHIIRSLSREGKSVVLVTHELRGALSFCTHVLHLGEENLFLSTEEYKNTAQCRAFLSGVCDA